MRGDRLYVPLYHPAAALYQASLMRTLEEDMQRVRDYLDEAAAQRRARAAGRAAPDAGGPAREPAAGRATGAEPAAAPARDQLSLF